MLVRYLQTRSRGSGDVQAEAVQIAAAAGADAGRSRFGEAVLHTGAEARGILHWRSPQKKDCVVPQAGYQSVQSNNTIPTNTVKYLKMCFLSIQIISIRYYRPDLHVMILLPFRLYLAYDYKIHRFGHCGCYRRASFIRSFCFFHRTSYSRNST